MILLNMVGYEITQHKLQFPEEVVAMKIYLLILLLLPLSMLLHGCVIEQVNISDDPMYKTIIDTQYTLLVDCYIGQYNDDKNNAKVLRPTGPNVPKVGFPSESPADPKWIGKTIAGFHIEGIIPKGASFTVVETVKMKQFEMTRYIWLVTLSEGDVWGKVSAELLLDKSHFPPERLDPFFVKKSN